jgi:hypothetical protein
MPTMKEIALLALALIFSQSVYLDHVDELSEEAAFVTDR